MNGILDLKGYFIYALLIWLFRVTIHTDKMQIYIGHGGAC